MNLLIALLDRVRGFGTTDGVLSSFRKTQQRLVRVENRQSERADRAEQAAAAAKAKAHLARTEARRAAEASGKLAEIFGR